MERLHVDPEMKSLLAELGKAVVPAEKRRVVFRTSWHSPYYSHNRYRKVV